MSNSAATPHSSARVPPRVPPRAAPVWLPVLCQVAADPDHLGTVQAKVANGKGVEFYTCDTAMAPTAPPVMMLAARLLLVSATLTATMAMSQSPPAPPVANGCVARAASDGIVCDCNATYCDTVPPLGAVLAGSAVVYTSSKAGACGRVVSAQAAARRHCPPASCTKSCTPRVSPQPAAPVRCACARTGTVGCGGEGGPPQRLVQVRARGARRLSDGRVASAFSAACATTLLLWGVRVVEDEESRTCPTTPTFRTCACRTGARLERTAITMAASKASGNSREIDVANASDVYQVGAACACARGDRTPRGNPCMLRSRGAGVAPAASWLCIDL